MNELSSIVPSAHQPALFFIQDGISSVEPVPCAVDGIFKMFSLTRNWIPWMNASSSIVPSAHHSALFFIQDGIVGFYKIADSLGISDWVPGPSSIIVEPIPE